MTSDSPTMSSERNLVVQKAGVVGKDTGAIRKNLLSKYLAISQDETFPLLSEYFGVALAFTALGSLIRRVNDRKALQGPVLKRKMQRSALDSLLRKAMERLREIAHRAQALEDKVKEEDCATAEQVERSELLRRLAEAEIDINEMKRRRSEDAKANEKVMAMFSTQEHLWKDERKRLKKVITTLRKELADCVGQLQKPAGKRSESKGCMECKKKDLQISDLTSELREKCFLMAAAAASGDFEHTETCQFAQKVALAEKEVETLKTRIASESEDHQAVLTRLQHVELELEDATDNINRAKLEAIGMVDSRKEVEERNAVLLEEKKQLKKELEDQEKVMATIVGRIETLKAENSRLSEKVAAHHNGHSIGVNERTTPKSNRYAWSANGHDVQAVQLKEIHATYMDQVAELENQLSYYQERILQLEDCALMRLDEYAGANNVHNEEMQKILLYFSDGVIPHRDVEVRDFQLRAAKSLLAQYIAAERARELELGKWRKLYSATKVALSMMQSSTECIPAKDPTIKQWIENAKAQQAAELSERHWYEIESFERHMKAKDERMEALRTHLLSLEKQIKTKNSELNDMRSCLEAEVAIRFDTEARLQETQEELKACMLKLEESRLSTNILSAKKKRFRNLERGQELNVREALENREAEAQGKDFQLALLEAKLAQVQLQYEKEKESRENLIAEVFKEKQVLENLVKESAEGTQEDSIKNAIAAACLEVEKLSEKIAEASEQIMQAGAEENQQHLQAFLEQATEVSLSGKVLKKLQGLLSTKCENLDCASTTARSDELVIGITDSDPASPQRIEVGEEPRATLASTLKKKLQEYHILLQKINGLWEEVDTGSSSTIVSSFLARAVELQDQVGSSAQKLSEIQANAAEETDMYPHILKIHLSEIQKRLELKIANMVQDLRARLHSGNESTV